MKRKQSSGLTVIELIIVMAIVTICLAIAMPDIAPFSSRYRLKAADREVATALQLTRLLAVKEDTTLVQDKTESLKNASISSLTSGNDSASVGNITYLRQWAISTVGNLKTITVTVNWTSRGPHGVSVTTLRGE